MDNVVKEVKQIIETSTPSEYNGIRSSLQSLIDLIDQKRKVKTDGDVTNDRSIDHLKMVDEKLKLFSREYIFVEERFNFPITFQKQYFRVESPLQWLEDSSAMILSNTNKTHYDIIYNTKLNNWDRTLFNKTIISKQSLLFLVFCSDIAISFFIDSQIVFDKYIEDPKFFVSFFRKTENGIKYSKYIRNLTSDDPLDAMLIYSKHSTRWFGSYDLWVQAKKTGNTEKFSDFSRHYSLVDGQIVDFIGKCKAESVIVLALS
ncbi:hypothetical protein EIN_058390 [Entamoeba invadens IP1]|uniref:hypothetical protein n=1 Tax=Entamoeba invadens IP1 TaxID=370355 RepID=UPI0002C3F195|nr:hypothetical protein EIN_058390 [Entamoeba invadens IP1]ELP93394.1 hypothetical protein EIN_058390 [Entamoeba invadens IP1]|eukprot:XP_004260165.1 hypothetical protein EIN_058390 [Entamoeba invadens IP1]